MWHGSCGANRMYSNTGGAQTDMRHTAVLGAGNGYRSVAAENREPEAGESPFPFAERSSHLARLPRTVNSE
jgi:hypothetical protein